MAEPRWTERSENDGGRFEVVVDGFDAERTEHREMDAFRRALTAPAREHEVIATSADGHKSSSGDVLRAVRVIVSLVIAAFVVAALGPLLDALGTSLSRVLKGLAFLLVVLGPPVVFAIRARRQRQRVAKVRARFQITLDARGFSLEGPASSLSQPLAIVERFEGDRRLVLVSKDGGRDVLAVSLASAADNAALADRLNDALVDVRAGAGGYRGGGPPIHARPRPSAADAREAFEVEDPSDRPPGARRAS